VTITNDKRTKLSFGLLEEGGKRIARLELGAFESAHINLEGKIKVNQKVRLKIKNTEENFSKKTKPFFAFHYPSYFKASEITSAKIIKAFEMKSLIQQVMPGLRISDREYYGTLCEKCFVANELVANLILHQKADDVEHAVEICQHLVNNKVFLPAMNKRNIAFTNHYLLFRLNEENPILQGQVHLSDIKGTGKATVLNLASDHNIGSISATSPRTKRSIETEGWLSKKSRLGFYQPRFFRILLASGGKSGSVLSYFDNTVSIVARASYHSSRIQHISLTGTSLNIRLSPWGNQKREKLILRAATKAEAMMWIQALQPLAQALSVEDSLRLSGLSHVMSLKEIQDFSKLLKRVCVKSGSVLYSEGEAVDTFYILMVGKVAVLPPKDTKKFSIMNITPMKEEKKEVEIKRRSSVIISSRTSISPRQSVGNAYELKRDKKTLFFEKPTAFLGKESLFNNHRPILSYKTATDCDFLILQGRERRAFFARYPNVSEKIVGTFGRGIDQCLAKSPIFKAVPSTSLKFFKSILTIHNIEAEDCIFKQKERGDSMYIVYHGSIELSKYDAKEREMKIIKTLGPGESFGESALLMPGIKRKYSAHSKEKSLILVTTYKRFQSFLRVSGLRLNDLLLKTIMECLMSSSFSFLHNESEEFIRQVAQTCKVESFVPNMPIVQEGDIGDKFYVVVEGQIMVTIGGKQVSTLSAGNAFGEIALVSKCRRTATCTTTMKTLTLSIDRKGFQEFFASKPAAMCQMHIKIAQRKSEIRPVINYRLGAETLEKFLTNTKKEDGLTMLRAWKALKEFRDWAISRPLTPTATTSDETSILEKKAGEMKRMLKESKCIEMPEELEKKLNSTDINAASFVPVETFLIEKLKVSYWKDFLKSKEFGEMLTEVGSYETTEKVGTMTFDHKIFGSTATKNSADKFWSTNSNTTDVNESTNQRVVSPMSSYGVTLARPRFSSSKKSR